MGKAAAIVCVFVVVAIGACISLDLRARYFAFGFPSVNSAGGAFRVAPGLTAEDAEELLLQYGIIRDDLPAWAVHDGSCRGYRRTMQTQIRNYRDEGWAQIGGCLVIRDGIVIDGGFSSSLGEL